MSLQQLPTELLDAVALQLAPTDLAALSRVAPVFYHVAQRRLYRHLRLDSSSLTCVFTLASCPHIASHVRSFEIRLSPQSTLLAAFYRRLALAIANMEELTSLVLAVDQAASWILRTPPHPRLRRFSSSFHLDHHLAHFLSKTDALLELHLDPPHDSLSPVAPLQHGALPLLNQFTGPSQAAQLLVPGRPVEHIHLNSGDLTEDLAETLARSTVPITELLATTTSHSVSLIGTLTRCMEQLVHLRLVTTYNFSDAPDAVHLLFKHCKRPNVPSSLAKL
ncbi:hypothetical protein JR316_0004717 [Psilocybe cubensis]|uniref:Uncharacterized protein n=1 Tax=Psilocybe cubensis TaxID=181762 RepID=A0ACB8H4K2_PSICU|nr:hypothetical protein JR316_0004717 [Psilocybe cubensis]KAH9482617.1 hypothetical protein JR316_0004717 [Psilocybe cubensis]